MQFGDTADYKSALQVEGVLSGPKLAGRAVLCPPLPAKIAFKLAKTARSFGIQVYSNSPDGAHGVTRPANSTVTNLNVADMPSIDGSSTHFHLIRVDDRLVFEIDGMTNQWARKP